MAKDVLEVLDAAIRDHRVSPQNAGAMQKARACIAELIAAGEEYKAAKRDLAAKDAWRVNPLPFNHPAVVRLCAANSRFDDALAACKGL